MGAPWGWYGVVERRWAAVPNAIVTPKGSSGNKEQEEKVAMVSYVD